MRWYSDRYSSWWPPELASQLLIYQTTRDAELWVGSGEGFAGSACLMYRGDSLYVNRGAGMKGWSDVDALPGDGTAAHAKKAGDALTRSAPRRDTMAESKPGKKSAQESAKSPRSDATFTDEERAAMREYVRERKAAVRGPRSDKADGETAVLEKIKAMAAPDRAIGERLHAIVRAAAPALAPKLWYGMPAYANRGRQRGVLFPMRAKIQDQVCDAGIQRQGASGRGPDVADRFRAQGVGCCRSGEGRRAGHASGRLKKWAISGLQ